MMKGFGARLRSRRLAKKRTQDWMARQLKVHRTTYTKYESEQVEPPLTTLVVLAQLLECSADWLLGLE